jgi:hypothetical protein
MQCNGLTQKNQRCKRKALNNESFCNIHTERGELSNGAELEQCPICLDIPRKNKIFDCQHSVCTNCYAKIKKCPLCRYPKFRGPIKKFVIDSYRNTLSENVLIMVRDYVAGFTSRIDLGNYIARLLSCRFRRYDYLRGIYILLTSDENDDNVMDKMIQLILRQST